MAAPAASGNALVGRPEQDIEVDAGGEDAARVKIAESRQRSAVAEQAGIEEVGAESAGLGLEFAKAQHAQFAGEGDKLAAQLAGRQGSAIRSGIRVHRAHSTCSLPCSAYSA
jgi:hypothetical protein